MDSGADDHFLRYRPDVRAWEQVPVPGEVARALGVQDAVVDISGATLDGVLVLQISDGDTVGFARYTAQGEWEPMGFSFAGDEEHPLHGTLASDGEQVYLFGECACPRKRATTAARTPTAWTLPASGWRRAARCRQGARIRRLHTETGRSSWRAA